MERNLRTVAFAVVFVSIVSISYLGLQNRLYPKVFPTVYYEEIDQGFYCGISTRCEYVIDNNVSWRSLWTDIHNISSETPQLPPVDFDQETVIAVFIGGFPTGGYSVEIKRIESTVLGFTIHIEETHPGEGCGLTMAFTQPYHIVKANLTNSQNVDFVYNIVTHDC